MEAIESVNLPALINGTADRGSSRALCTTRAISMGYRVIDTAGNPAHDEEAIGSHIDAAIRQSLGSIQRADITVQSKYSTAVFFSQNAPYQEEDSIPAQILKSITQSLTRLRLDYIDIYMLHQPLRTIQQTLVAWEVMEEITRRGGARYLGICQVDLLTLKVICEGADVKPVAVQNYFTKQNAYDYELRAYCKTQGIIYQAFGILDRHNDDLLRLPSVVSFATRHNCPVQSSLFAHLSAAAKYNGEKFCILDGSRNPEHMLENLKALDKIGEIDRGQISEIIKILKSE